MGKLLDAVMRLLFGGGSGVSVRYEDGDVLPSKRQQPAHVVYVDVPRPQGLPRKLYGDVAVAGVSHRQQTLQEFFKGQNHHVELEPEPTNPADSNAIKVIGLWMNGGTQFRGHLGYLPSDIARDIATNHSALRIAATPETMFLPREGKSGGIRIDIWAPRRKTKNP